MTHQNAAWMEEGVQVSGLFPLSQRAYPSIHEQP
ncbi:hypothetical protein EPYR_03691 [Erwinia pyrifoliae DSM 12163]|nr:hypothetical protein EPYR_03691 [Erwinia pyrifoliae DSM 12163]